MLPGRVSRGVHSKQSQGEEVHVVIMSTQRFTAGVDVAGRPRASAPSSGSGCLSEPQMDAALSFLFLSSFCLSSASRHHHHKKNFFKQEKLRDLSIQTNVLYPQQDMCLERQRAEAQ